MKKLILAFMITCLITGCSALSVTSREVSSTSTSKTSSISPIASSAESGLALTGIDLYMKCFNEGKYDIYNLKIGDPVRKAINEFGQGKEDEYGLGAVCYKFKDVVVSFGEGTNLDLNKIIDFDIVGKGITAYGLTTGLSTIEDVKKAFGEPEEEWDAGHHSYESFKTLEDFYDEGEIYYAIQYDSKDYYFYVNFFFEYGVLTVISLGRSIGFE